MSAKRDYYEVLEVPRDASADAIKLPEFASKYAIIDCLPPARPHSPDVHLARGEE